MDGPLIDGPLTEGVCTLGVLTDADGVLTLAEYLQMKTTKARRLKVFIFILIYSIKVVI